MTSSRSFALRLASLVVFCTLSANSSLYPYQAQPQTKAPESFDVVSIKLYMTGAEVIEALRARFGINPAKDLIVGKKPGVYDSKASYIPYVQYKTAAFDLDVEFWEVFPVSGKRESAYRVSYFAKTKTAADIDVMKQKALEKYGPPATTGPRGSDVWCQMPCDVLTKPQLEAVQGFDGGFFVHLTDEGFRKRTEEAFNKTKTGAAPL